MATRIQTRKDGTVLVERFTLPRRAEHMLVLVTFVALTLTGLPQKFDGYYAQATLAALGGLDLARAIHRFAGLVFCVHSAVHILLFVGGLLAGRMRWTMLPVLQDLRDAKMMLAYYLGAAKRPPELPKFDYRQKFEYLGMVLGGLVMVVSGLMLLYPQWFSAYLPGELIPAARVAHSNEAMLALLVLVVWHVYGSHLSPEVFNDLTSLAADWLLGGSPRSPLQVLTKPATLPKQPGVPRPEGPRAVLAPTGSLGTT